MNANVGGIDRTLRIVHDALLALGEAQATLGMASSI